MSRTIMYDSKGRDITCMKEFDALKYPCQECDREDCEERKDYDSEVEYFKTWKDNRINWLSSQFE